MMSAHHPKVLVALLALLALLASALPPTSFTAQAAHVPASECRVRSGGHY